VYGSKTLVGSPVSKSTSTIAAGWLRHSKHRERERAITSARHGQRASVHISYIFVAPRSEDKLHSHIWSYIKTPYVRFIGNTLPYNTNQVDPDTALRSVQTTISVVESLRAEQLVQVNRACSRDNWMDTSLTR
jgi:hypothetical protein